MTMRPKISYAQDPLNLLNIGAEITALVAKFYRLNWYAVIDSAFDFRERRENALAHTGVNCFDFPEFKGLEAAAPLLLPLDPNERGADVDQLLRHCRGRPMLSFVATTMTIEAVRDYWRPYHWVIDNDGQRFLLRFTDTRVLAKLPEIYTAAQWAGISGPMQQWITIDRGGKLQDVPIQRIAPHVLPFRLSNAQVTALISAAEPDAIFGLIWENMSEIFPADVRLSEAYDFVAKTYNVGHSYKMNFSEIVVLSVACLLSGKPLLENAEFHEFLRARNWGTSDFADALAICISTIDSSTNI